MVNYIIQFEKRGENLKVFFKDSMEKEKKTVKEISTKISLKDIFAFFGKLSSNNKIEVIDPEIGKKFGEAYKECQKLYKELKDKKPQVERNNVPNLSGKVQIKVKGKGEVKRKGESCEEKIIQ